MRSSFFDFSFLFSAPFLSIPILFLFYAVLLFLFLFYFVMSYAVCRFVA